MTWFTLLSVPVQYTIIALIAAIAIGIIIVILYTLKRGGKVKAGPVEFDTEEEHPQEEKK